MTGMVQTVLGPVRPEALGVTLPHEHILGTLDVYLEEPRDEAEARLLEEPLTAANLPTVRAEPYRNRENTRVDDEDLAVRELILFRDAGGSTVADQTLPDIGRDLAGLARVARRTGLHFVAGCGSYLDETHSLAVAESTVEELAERLVAELTADAATDGIPCGVLGEIGLSSPMTAADRKALRTAALACVDAEIDSAYQTAIAARGAFVDYDFFGWGEIAATGEHFVHTDLERVAGAAEPLDFGHRDRVLLTQDVVTCTQLTEYGGSGNARLARDLPPLFAESA